MRTTALSIAVFLLSPSIVSAQNTLVGAGSIPCATVNVLATVPATDEAQKPIMLTWAQGYMSSVNISRINLHRQPVSLIDQSFPPGSQTEFLVSYCKSNSGQMLVAGVVQLYRAMAKLQGITLEINR